MLGLVAVCWFRLAYWQPPTPKFEDYRVNQTFTGKPAKPRFTHPAELPADGKLGPNSLLPDADPRYRESTELYAEHGPNFAGRYTIARWSCGTGCSSMIVIDAKTGHLYREAPYGTLDINAGSTRSDHSFSGLSFQLNSKLLIAEGCLDVDSRISEGKEVGCSRNYYVWEPPRFRLLRAIRLTSPDWLREEIRDSQSLSR